MKLKLITVLFLLFQIVGYAQLPANRIKVSDDIELIRLSPKAFLHVSVSGMPGFGKVSSNGLILIDGGQAFLFDTPATSEQTGTLVTFIADSLHASVAGFVPNHWHGDCMGGLNELHKRGIKSYANQMTIDIAGEKGLPIPQQGFKDSLSLKLNDMEMECHYLGGGHSVDNIVVWVPSENILFAGCMVKDLQSGGLGNLSDANIKEWPATIRKVMEKFPSAGIVIPGHGQCGGKELLAHTLALFSKQTQEMVPAKALLIIDIQNDYFEGGANALTGSWEASLNAKAILNDFRDKSLPVIHIQHISDYPGATFFIPATTGVEIHENVKPVAGETIITKYYPNSFLETGLLGYLKSKDITELVICGMMTHMCVDATTRAAKDLGFTCTVIGDACATRDLEILGETVVAGEVHKSFLAALNYYYSTVKNTQEYLSGK